MLDLMTLLLVDCQYRLMSSNRDNEKSEFPKMDRQNHEYAVAKGLEMAAVPGRVTWLGNRLGKMRTILGLAILGCSVSEINDVLLCFDEININRLSNVTALIKR